MTDDRGQSELIGFVLAFAIIVASIAIVFTAGFSSLQDIKLSDARLFVDDPIEITVNVEGEPFNATYELRPIVYDADTGTQIVYVQGAVLRDQRDGGVVMHESTLLLNESRTMIPMVQTRLSGTDGIAGRKKRFIVAMIVTNRPINDASTWSRVCRVA